MKKRCLNPKDKRWKDYGGRGITIDPRWLDFENFVEDMGLVPESYQIDRINNSKGYSKANCRWATRKEQQRNMRTNRWLTCGGETLILSEWARKLRVSEGSILYRLERMSVTEALTTPFVRKDWSEPKKVTCPWCRASWTSKTKQPKWCNLCKCRLSDGVTYMKAWHDRKRTAQ